MTPGADVPEFCPCGAEWLWAEGVYRGVQEAEGERYEMRDCKRCGSSRMRVLDLESDGR